MKSGVGLVLGKFLPPHRGHVYLCEVAAAQVERLHVVVGTLASEPIPGALRHAWMCELVPQAEVHHLQDENPQEPAEHPEFWNIWRESLERILPEPVQRVFASEPYGERLAQELGATFVPVDLERLALPLSGTQIRADPLAMWSALPRVVRPYYARRVCLLGPESTGKSTLAARLAAHFQTRWVPEYARAYLERRGGRIELSDMEVIARSQLASEQALARECDRVLICDSDALTTELYSRVLFGAVPEGVRELSLRGDYALTLLSAPDVPFVPDPVRYLPEARAHFFDLCRAELEARGRRYVVLQGGWDERWRTAQRAIEALDPSLAPRGC